MSTRSGYDRIDTSQSSEFIVLGAAVMLVVIISVLFLGQQLAQLMLAIAAGLQV